MYSSVFIKEYCKEFNLQFVAALEPIFEIESIKQTADGMKYVIQGTALDCINIGDQLFMSSLKTQEDCCVIESIEIGGREIKRAYAFMSVDLRARLKGNVSIFPEKYLYDIVDDYIAEIDFKQAGTIAENAAFDSLDQFRENLQVSLLRDEFAEAECCWFFFRNKEIVGPPERALTWDKTYVVSKKGNLFSIVDLSDKPEELRVYIQRYSSHLKRLGQ